MNNLKTALVLPLEARLHPVGDTGFFVKQRTVSDVNALAEVYDNDNWNLVKELAVNLYDKDGNLVYDVQNPDDLALVERLPHAFFNQVIQLRDKVNAPDFFPSLATDKS